MTEREAIWREALDAAADALEAYAVKIGQNTEPGRAYLAAADDVRYLPCSSAPTETYSLCGIHQTPRDDCRVCRPAAPTETATREACSCPPGTVCANRAHQPNYGATPPSMPTGYDAPHGDSPDFAAERSSGAACATCGDEGFIWRPGGGRVPDRPCPDCTGRRAP